MKRKGGIQLIDNIYKMRILSDSRNDEWRHHNGRLNENFKEL
jgi:hypothetical protein